jgi:HD-GYP domain-containing protein (c-di-GMP phosphodiesterase class II)
MRACLRLGLVIFAAAMSSAHQATSTLQTGGTVQVLPAHWQPEELVSVPASQLRRILTASGLGVFALLVAVGVAVRSRSHHVRARRALEAELHRTAAFTRQLLVAGRKRTSTSVFEINALIRGLEPLVRQLVGSEIALVVYPGHGEWHVEADPGEIEQLVLKLAINARDAIGVGGRLTINTDSVSLDDEFARAHGARAGGPFVTIVVRDTGSGTLPDATDKLVHGIVQDAGGCLVSEDTPGRGGTFRVFLPQVDAKLAAPRTLDEYRPDELDSAEAVLRSLALMVEARDAYTDGHCQRLADYAVRLGERLRLPHEDLVTLRRGGYFHDIGKIGIPDSILMKPGALTPEEYARLKAHPVMGERLCGDLRVLHRVRPIVRWHHELLDGSGYPDGLRGDAIPLLAQIIGIVDVFDALTTSRPYRAALSVDQASAHLRLDVKDGRRSAWLVNEFLATVRQDHPAQV